MSLFGMTVQNTQPASLLPLLSLSDYSEEAASAGAFAQLLNMFLAPPLAAQIAPPAPADSAASSEFSMLPAAAPALAHDPANRVGAEVFRLDKKSLGIGDLPALPASEPCGFTIVESAAIAPTLAEQVLDTSQTLASAAVAQEIGATPTDAVDATPVTIARRPVREEEPPANDIAQTEWVGSPQVTLTQSPIGVALPAMFEASDQSELTNDMRQSASPLSKSTGLDGSAVLRSPMVDTPTALASETATAVAPLELLNQANDDLTSKQQVALPIAATKAPARSDDRDILKGQSSRSENHASMMLNDSFIANPTAPLSKSTGVDGSAVPRSPMVDTPTALPSETATAVERQPLELFNQANDDLMSKQPVATPIAATKAPARSNDRDNLNAPSLRSENHASMTLNDFFIANATAALKQSDGMRRLPFTERPLEIDPEPTAPASGAANFITVKQDAEKSQAGIAAASPGDEHSAAKDGWQGQPREGDAPGNPSMVAGAAPARVHHSDRGETAAPAWRPMVERLARDIGEHFRVGEQQALLRLEPP